MILDIQHVCEDIAPISDDILTQWVQLTLATLPRAELTLRMVTPIEIQELNHRYRKKNQPTNVLAFPAEYPKILPLEVPFLGDIVICPQVLKEESNHLQTPLTAHWAHIVIHGVLHLLGYDHMNDEEEKQMQSCEIALLSTLGFNNPYAEANEIE